LPADVRNKDERGVHYGMFAREKLFKPSLDIEKEFIQFGMQESREEKSRWVELSETWTITA